MTDDEVSHEFRKMVDDVIVDIGNRQYFSMKDGIDAALVFLEAKRKEGVIGLGQCAMLMTHLKDRVFDALATEYRFY